MRSRLIALLVSLAISSAALAQIPRVTPLVDVAFEPEEQFETFDAALVQDSSWSYLGTPGGLYRLPHALTSGVTPIPISVFRERAILNSYVRNGALYVLKNGRETRGSAATDHAFFRSSDGGQTFQPLDQKLESCFGGYCSFLTPTEAVFRGNTILLNAGGNLLVTPDEGSSWSVLVGELAPQACYHPTFTVIGNRVLIGGECPLDTAYIRAGTLQPDGLRWERQPEPVITPFLENRNVQFIRRVGESSVVFAGIEGALLRSTDFGASFEFVLRQEQGVDEKYAYIGHFLAPSRHRDAMIIGGFDKAAQTPYLAFSWDEGRTWHDWSHLVMFSDHNFSALVFLTEDASGRVLAGVQSWESSLIRIVEIDFARVTRRRAVRP